MTSAPFVNEPRAQQLIDGITDPVVRNLVTLGVAEMRLRFSRPVGQTEKEWLATLPSASVDLRLYAEVLLSLFSKTDLVRAVMAGQSLAEASGWDP